MKEEYIRIVCAAMLMDDGHIVTGVRHFSPDMRATMARLYGKGLRIFNKWWLKPYHMHVVKQGFIDNMGQFHDRESAAKIADARGQIMLFDPAGSGHRIQQKAGTWPDMTLFSENLY